MELKTLSKKLEILKRKGPDNKIKIMIIGLGSVGHYLLDYLVSEADESMEIIVCGRNTQKMTVDVNIVNVAASIRGKKRAKVTVDGTVDLNNVDSITSALQNHRPDIIVNSSRAYAHIKYGAISWNNIRAYGIWSPLAIKYTKNIMQAYEFTDGEAIVINTSYSDAVIPWLKSAGKAYPDLGSGNFNHLIPRIQMSVGKLNGIEDFWNIDITYATAHFHDVVISKEGQTEGVKQLIDIRYKGKKLALDMTEVFSHCNIAMPVDAKRNMMNASSNYEIIKALITCIREPASIKLHCPGAFGEIGGYPVRIDSTQSGVLATIDESIFPLEKMQAKNRESIYLDGVEDIREGNLFYTDELLEKVERVFKCKLPKQVAFEDIDKTAEYIIENIIEKYRS